VATVKEKVDRLEQMMRLVYIRQKTEMEIQNLKEEMREFKNEMADFKDEMRAFKDEMKVFKDEMKAFKDEMIAFKNEMKVFKDEMKAFKDEMRTFKDLTERSIEELKRNVKELNRRWGDLSKRLGMIVEDMIAPVLPEIAKRYFKCDSIEDFSVRRRKTKPGDTSRIREFDVILVCRDKVLLNETKATPRYEYVKDFVEFVKSGEFFEYFPEYEGKEFIPIFSSLHLPDDIVSYLTEKGIYAMGMRGDTMDILNFEEVSKK